MNNILNKYSSYSHYLPRVVLAITFLVHGFPKLTNPSPMVEMGMPLLMVYLVGLFEVGGAGLLLYGIKEDWATRIGSILLAVIMIGAIFMVHLQNGWNNMNNGFEWQALILAICLLYATKGNSINKGIQNG